MYMLCNNDKSQVYRINIFKKVICIINHSYLDCLIKKLKFVLILTNILL